MPLRLDFYLFLIKPTFLLRGLVLIAIILLASPLLSSHLHRFLHSKNPVALLFPLSVPTQCGACGFHDGCSLPLTPGD